MFESRRPLRLHHFLLGRFFKERWGSRWSPPMVLSRREPDLFWLKNLDMKAKWFGPGDGPFKSAQLPLCCHAFIQLGGWGWDEAGREGRGGWVSGATSASLSQTLNYNLKTVCFAFWATGVCCSGALQTLLTSFSISARDLIVMPIKLTCCIWNQEREEEGGGRRRGTHTEETWRLGSRLSRHA